MPYKPTHYLLEHSNTATHRVLRGDYVLHNCPTRQAIGKIVKKFIETGVEYKCWQAENITIVSESVAEDSNVSIPRYSQELGLSYGTL